MKSSTETAIVHYKSFQRQRNLRHMSKRLTYCCRGFILRPTAVRHIVHGYLRNSEALSQTARQVNQALKARNHYAIEQHKSNTGNTTTAPTPTPSLSLQPRHRHTHSRETPRQINQHAMPCHTLAAQPSQNPSSTPYTNTTKGLLLNPSQEQANAQRAIH
jgi:hypothetical protein